MSEPLSNNNKTLSQLLAADQEPSPAPLVREIESGGEPKQPNKQLYENSGLGALFAASPLGPVAEGQKANGQGLFNARTPNLAILHEKPEHRLLLWAKAQGASNREISQQSGYTEPWLSQLFRQPWAQTILVEMMTAAGMDVVQQTLKAAAPDSVFKLIELRDDPDTPAAVQAKVCDSLLDRYLGKPNQRVEVQQTTQLSNDSIAELDKQIEKLTIEENRLAGRF